MPPRLLAAGDAHRRFSPWRCDAGGTARRRPIPAAPLKLPAYTRTTLKERQVVYVPSRRLPLVDFRLLVRAGSVNDPSGKQGSPRSPPTCSRRRGQPQRARSPRRSPSSAAPERGCERRARVLTCEVLKKDFAIGSSCCAT